ncbi:MAG: inositol monophosphatase family protein [Gaiellaceae bacterium]
MTAPPEPDWVALCRAAVEDVKAVLEELPTRVEREPVVRQGEGGDETTAIDQAAEDAILARFRDLDVTIVSEEVGRFGDGSTLVVIDPIDGSLNAKRGIPFFSLSIAFADGERMGDVFLGYVYDFGTGEEWIGRRGEGATRNGEPLGAVKPKDRIEILSFEATLTSLVAAHAAAVAGLAYRLRIMGSLALSLCHLAAGRVDAVCSLKAARSVDIAAAQLLCREVGLSLSLFEDPRRFEEAELDLLGRSRLAAAGTVDLCAQVATALSA